MIKLLIILFIIFAPIIIIVIVEAVVNAGKRSEQRREEALRAMYSQNNSNTHASEPNFRIEAIRNLKEIGKPFDEYDVELETEKIKSCSKQCMSEEVRSSENIPQGRQPIIINQLQSQSNGTGTAGFRLALIAVSLGLVPVLDWILWVLGLILSFAGVFKSPKRLAVAGLVISLIDLILLVTVFGAIRTLLGGLLERLLRGLLREL